MKTIKDTTVNCKKHGTKIPSIEFSVDEKPFLRVCFMCACEKVFKGLKGLKNHVKK
jgi:hypothetical protein